MHIILNLSQFLMHSVSTWSTGRYRSAAQRRDTSPLFLRSFFCWRNKAAAAPSPPCCHRTGALVIWIWVPAHAHRPTYTRIMHGRHGSSIWIWIRPVLFASRACSGFGQCHAQRRLELGGFPTDTYALSWWYPARSTIFGSQRHQCPHEQGDGPRYEVRGRDRHAYCCQLTTMILCKIKENYCYKLFIYGADTDVQRRRYRWLRWLAPPL